MAKSQPRLFLTVDVEDFAVDFLDRTHLPSRLPFGLERLLQLFEAEQAKSTFFWLVQCARRHPELLRRAVAAGHRIGLHGLDHQFVYLQQPDAFGRAIRQGRMELEDLAGTFVTTYRAPFWSVTRQSLWALDEILGAGFQVDSSIFPTKNHQYGIPDAPIDPYLVRPGLVEIPPSVARVLGRNVPFGGGFYLRALPSWMTERLVQRTQAQGRNVMLYVHPWELDVDQPRDLPYGLLGRFIHYHGIHGTEAKLRSILRRFGRAEALPETFSEANRLIHPAAQTGAPADLIMARP